MNSNEIKVGAVIRNRRSGKTWEVVETPPGEWPRAKIRSPRSGACHFESVEYLARVCEPVDQVMGVWRYTDYGVTCDEPGCRWFGDGPREGNYETLKDAVRALREHMKEAHDQEGRE